MEADEEIGSEVFSTSLIRATPFLLTKRFKIRSGATRGFTHSRYKKTEPKETRYAWYILHQGQQRNGHEAQDAIIVGALCSAGRGPPGKITRPIHESYSSVCRQPRTAPPEEPGMKHTHPPLHAHLSASCLIPLVLSLTEQPKGFVSESLASIAEGF